MRLLFGKNLPSTIRAKQNAVNKHEKPSINTGEFFSILIVSMLILTAILALAAAIAELIIKESKRASHHHFLTIPFSHIHITLSAALSLITALQLTAYSTRANSYLQPITILVLAGTLAASTYMATQLIFVWRKRTIPEILPQLLLTAASLAGWATIPYSALVQLAASHTTAFILMHNIGAVLGVGGSTYLDIFIHQKLKRAHIGSWHHAAGSARLFAHMIFLGLLLLTVSGIALLIPHANILFGSTKFLTKLIILSMLIANGALMHFLILPRLLENHSKRDVRLFYASSAVSLTCWYAVFILGALGRITTPPLWVMLVGITLLLILTTTLSQLLIRTMDERK